MNIHNPEDNNKIHILNVWMFWGWLTIFGLIALLVGLAFYYEPADENRVYREILNPESPKLISLREREKEALNNYKLLDAEIGVYQIPIDRAIELIAEKSKK